MTVSSKNNVGFLKSLLNQLTTTVNCTPADKLTIPSGIIRKYVYYLFFNRKHKINILPIEKFHKEFFQEFVCCHCGLS